MRKTFALALLVGLGPLALVAALIAGCSSKDEYNKSTPAPADQANLVYSPVIAQGGPGCVDVYYPIPPLVPSTPAPIPSHRPALIVIHGGGWRSGSKLQVGVVSRNFANEGYVVFAPNYSLAPAVQWPAPLDDLRLLVGFMRRNADTFGIDGNQIGAWGGSAGGHLATALALIDDPNTPPPAPGRPSGGRIQFAVDAFGPADLSIEGGMAPDEDGILRDFLGAPRATLDPRRIADASTTTYARKDASVLILHGTADSFVSIRHSERLYTALLSAGADTEIVRVEGGRHDASTYDSAEARAATLQFFKLRVQRSFP